MSFISSLTCFSSVTKALGDTCVLLVPENRFYTNIKEKLSQINKELRGMENKFEDEFKERISAFLSTFKKRHKFGRTQESDKQLTKFVRELFFTHFLSFYDKHSVQINYRIYELENFYENARNNCKCDTPVSNPNLSLVIHENISLKSRKYIHLEDFVIKLEKMILLESYLCNNELFDMIYNLKQLPNHINTRAIKNEFYSGLYVYRECPDRDQFLVKYNPSHDDERFIPAEELYTFIASNKYLRFNLLREYSRAGEDDIRFVSLRNAYNSDSFERLKETEDYENLIEAISRDQMFLNNYFEYISYAAPNNNNPFSQKYEEIYQKIIKLIKYHGLQPEFSKLCRPYEFPELPGLCELERLLQEYSST